MEIEGRMGVSAYMTRRAYRGLLRRKRVPLPGDAGSSRKAIGGIRRIVFVVLLVLAAVAPARSQDVDLRVRGNAISFNRFEVQPKPDLQEALEKGRLHIHYAGQPVSTSDPVQLDQIKTTLRLDWPEQGLSTLLVSTFSGGAHCCFETTLLTSGPDGDTCDRINGENTPAALETSDGDDFLGVLDWGLAYYASKTGSVSLSFAESPGMKRRLVHDAKGWRVNTPGEYKEYYRELLASRKRPDLRTVNPAFQENAVIAYRMETVYYLLMAGEEEKNVLAKWRAGLPGKLAKAYDDVFADVVKAVHAFNPIVRQPLPTEPAPGS
jgi:hypothetical protein